MYIYWRHVELAGFKFDLKWTSIEDMLNYQALSFIWNVHLLKTCWTGFKCDLKCTSIEDMWNCQALSLIWNVCSLKKSFKKTFKLPFLRIAKSFKLNFYDFLPRAIHEALTVKWRKEKHRTFNWSLSSVQCHKFFQQDLPSFHFWLRKIMGQEPSFSQAHSSSCFVLENADFLAHELLC